MPVSLFHHTIGPNVVQTLLLRPFCDWFPVTDANFDAPINIWNLAYIESIFIALFRDFVKKFIIESSNIRLC